MWAIVNQEGKYYIADDEEFGEVAKAYGYRTKAEAEADIEIVLRQWCWEDGPTGVPDTLRAVEVAGLRAGHYEAREA